MKKYFCMFLILMCANVFPFRTAAAAAAASDKYLITEKGVGDFVLGERIPASAEGFEITEEKQPGGEGEDETVYVVSEKGEKALELMPDYPDDTKIFQIMIFSDGFHTEEGIKVGASLEDLVEAYRQYSLWYTYIGDMYVFEVEGRSGTQFLLDSESFVGKQDLYSGDSVALSLEDFKSATKITSIRIYRSHE